MSAKWSALRTSSTSAVSIASSPRDSVPGNAGMFAARAVGQRRRNGHPGRVAGGPFGHGRGDHRVGAEWEVRAVLLGRPQRDEQARRHAAIEVSPGAGSESHAA